MRDDPTKFKSEYIKTEVETSDLIDSAVSSMIDAYETAYARIFARLSRARKSVDFITAKSQDVLMRGVSEELLRFRNAGSGILRDALLKITETGATSAHSHLSLFMSTEKLSGQEIASHAERALRDADEYFVMQIERMRTTIRQMLREDASKVFRRATLDGITRGAAFGLLRSEIQNRSPELKFIDRAGRRWDSRTYFEMLTKTVLSTSLRERYVDQLIDSGHDLAIVSRVGSKDACRFWENRILSLTGSTPGYPTLDQATSTGQVFHPRCRHRLIAYHPDITGVLGIEAK